MRRKLFLTFTGLLWTALALTGLRFWQVWDQLPARMATHFDASWQPNGWMSKLGALESALGITALMLAVFTTILLVMYWQKVTDAFAWMMLVFSYVVMGFTYYANISVVEFNLTGQGMRLGTALTVLAVTTLLLIAVYVGSGRGTPLPPHRWMATETHASSLWAVILLLPLVLELAIFVMIPENSLRVALGLMSVLFVAVAVFAWKGFEYCFGPAGVEIRALGFRLRSIPLSEIKQYQAARWNPLRGYGIRGVGRCRAYVWGNKGVRITTSEGEVFLGHNAPERILHDLDAIKQFAR
jgi:Domain of unknown function (DUF1648)